MRHTLYICYFGVREPLVQTQVIPYLREIVKGGIKVSLITFEPDFPKNWRSEQIKSIRDTMAEMDIAWECLAYHKRPSAVATAYDIYAGSWFIRKKIRRESIDVLHGRIHVATLMGAIARKFSRRKPKLIFDIRGFFPEEYTDAGIWPENSWLFRGAKRVENWLMRESDGFVVLTEKAREIVFGKNGSETPELVEEATAARKPVEVIPCCVDFVKRFQDQSEVRSREIAKRLHVRDRFVITHVGALGGLYLTEEIVDFLVAARSVEPTTFALFLTQTDPKPVTELLKRNGFLETDYFIGKVDPAEIPAYLCIANVGLSFVKATYATQSRSPTKIPEYLAAGLPIIANSGVGDVDELIRDDGVGVLIDNFDRESYVDALRRLSELGDIDEKCRISAKSRFDLQSVGGVRYRRLYERLFCNDEK
jgi:glycosyltransferase involved in cell wall biosynthesis